MKNIITIAITLLSLAMSAQDTGSIVGTLTDKDANNEPLPFANVIIKATSTGTTSDFDGLYAIENLVAGDYIIEVSFVGYETMEVPATVVVDKVTTVNIPMGASAAALDEVIITTTIRRESQVALLLEQKKATSIKESIGSEQLAQLGIRDAAGATAKISGVSKTDGSGDVFVRGLGDRYLYTTLNGLPIPSDNIERKNIDLSLFTTRLIESIDVSKTTSARLSADQASGNIDISSKDLNGNQELSISASSSINTNVIGNDVFGNFKVSPNNANVTAGFYARDLSTRNALTQESWNPETVPVPVNRSFSVNAGKKIGEKTKVLLSLGQSSNFEYREGVFRQFRSNFIDDTIPDAIQWRKTVATSALASIKHRVNDNHRVELMSLFINTVEDQVFEGGRAGTATIFEETDDGEAFQFIRDQNLKKTLATITQLLGTSKFGEKNTLDWGLGYNYLSADEPNRIRNEVNFNFTDGSDIVQLGRQGGFQQRKSIQIIEDVEYNGRINDEIILAEGAHSFKLDVGANYRNKERNFGSQFYGVEETFTNAINPTSIDHISDIFTQTNITNGLLKINRLEPDFYNGSLTSAAAYVEATGVTGKLTVQGGLRYQRDDIDVAFAVNNFPGREGRSEKDYRRLYPSVNLKYAVNEKFNVRFANSFTTTLPEFKEIAPFEYVSQTGQITRGNPDIDASINRNFDLKFEYFLSKDQLISITGFHKNIDNPINKVQDRGSAGIFSYFNAGEEANIYGIELDTRITIIDGSETDTAHLKLNLNATRMWHKQDLKETFDEDGNFLRTFRYNNKTEVGLQGASNWILNGALNYGTNTDLPFEATLSGTYASDRIFALGSPEIQTSGDINYNESIVENGFVVLDLIFGKQLTEKLKLGVTAKNLLNPEIKRTQEIRNPNTQVETNETVLSYTRGAQLGINVKYTF
jgi:TonB-dependent receptor